MKYKVVELFVSINGEGIKAGELAYFIRFAGCNLNCSYCDTKWANDSQVVFTWMTKGQIYDRIKDSGIKNITLTGGEPLLQKGIENLLDLLEQDESLAIEIETNGSIDLEKFKKRNYKRISFTMDYKLKASEMENQMHLSNFDQMSHQDVVKFVVNHPDELEKVAQIISDYKLIDKCYIILSPVYDAIKPELIVEFMKEKQLNRVRMQLQLHKIIWHPEERGV